MRTIPLSVQQLIAAGEAIDPIMIIGIAFGVAETYYADRDLGDPLNPGIKGKILEFGQLEAITRVDGSGSASSISFKLDDSDGNIKRLFDTMDLTFRRVSLYQYFDGLSLNDMVMLFEGVLASPIEWDEGTRSVSMSAITRQSNFQVGFALNESNTPVYHQSLLNEPWPMVFGSPIYTKTLLLQEIPIGYLLNAFVLPDPSIGGQLQSLDNQIQTIRGENSGIELAQSGTYDSFGNTYSTFEDYQEFIPQYNAWAQRQNERINSVILQIYDLNSQHALQVAKFSPTNYVVGGYRFPQGIELICKINERTFKIIFNGGTYKPVNPEEPCPISLKIYESPYLFTPYDQLTLAQQHDVNQKALAAEQSANQLGISNSAAQLAALIATTPLEIPRAGAQYFEEGSQVELLDNLPGGYWHVASITPGTVQGIYAYRVVNGYRRLAEVPTKYYSVHQQSQSGLVFTYVILLRPLSTVSYFDNQVTTPYDLAILHLEEQQNQLGVSLLTNKIEWEDDIFVNFQSTIGPNVVDIITWLIRNYTLYGIDPVSFARVRANQVNYPANFVLTSRPVVDQLIQDIAYQSRCAVWIKSNIYYIKYLAADPIVTSTITDDHIDFGSLKVAMSSTDDLTTKYVATWRVDGLHDASELVIFNNVKKYGIIEEQHDFFIYNNYNLVMKSATFWCILNSNIWKTVTAKLHLNRLDVETLDDVNLQLTEPYVTSNSSGVACQVESSKYNSDDNTIEVELWTGIRVGEMVQYSFVHPSGLSTYTLSPLYTEQYTGAVPILPSEIFTPQFPYFNNMQTRVLILPDTIINQTDENGFVASNEPASKGDPYPSDNHNVYANPRPISLSYTSSIPPDNSYIYRKIPASLPVVATADILAKSFPGQVMSIAEDGTIWSVKCYPNGVENDGVLKLCKEGHNDPDLVGIESEWVTVFRIVLENGTRSYTFFSQHTMAFPVLMSDKNTGDIYLKGSNGTPETDMPVGQIQIASGYDIPTGTWAIGVRVWNGSTAKYEVQVPVWLPPS